MKQATLSWGACDKLMCKSACSLVRHGSRMDPRHVASMSRLLPHLYDILALVLLRGMLTASERWAMEAV